MTFQNIRLTCIVVTVAVLLTVPLIAMRFTDEVKWDGRDFLIMGLLLLGTGLTCELVLRKVTALGARLGICAAILLAFFLVWAELAVGLFGTPFAGS